MIVWYRLTTIKHLMRETFPSFFQRENGKSHMEFLCMKFTFVYRQQFFKRALPVIFHPEKYIIDGKLFFVRGALGLIRMSSRVPHVGTGFGWSPPHIKEFKRSQISFYNLLCPPPFLRHNSFGYISRLRLWKRNSGFPI